MPSSWFATAPSKTDRTRITLNFGLGRADRQLNELVVPQLGRIWFVRQLSWPLAALSLGERLRGTKNVKPSAISHGLEALGCKLEWSANRDSERLLGKRAFGRDEAEDVWAFEQLRSRRHYVQNTYRQAAVRPIREGVGFGFVTGSRFNTFTLTDVGKQLAEAFLDQVVGARNGKVTSRLVRWICGEDLQITPTPALRKAMAPSSPSERERALVDKRVFGVADDACQRRCDAAKALGTSTDLRDTLEVAEWLSRVRKLASLRSAIRNLPDICISYGEPTLDIGDYRARNGEDITEQLLGIWLGHFDLVVVDEAHKSRGEIEEESAKHRTERARVLVRLLGNILVETPDSRRLCLTATPMELDVGQWAGLLLRAHVDIGESGAQVIEHFKRATEEAALAPDEVARIEALRKASTAFTKTLRPYVTRRRRSDDRVIKEITAAGAGGKGPHPHRDIQPLRVNWTDPAVRASKWVDVLFAAECMSHAARGLSANDIGHAAKTAYTKLCSGHVSDFDLDGDGDDDEAAPLAAQDDADRDTRGKIDRVNYWRVQLRDARQEISAGAIENDDLIDSEHPRITLAVREIEAWTEGTAPNARKDGEKVLVFGVYLRPLRMLRSVLNIRHSLRAADARRPIAHAFDKELMDIGVRQLERMRDEGKIQGRLVRADARDLRKALRDAHDEYERLQNRLRRSVAHITERWFTAADRLGGITEKFLLDSVRSHAMAFVLDHFLSDVGGQVADRVEERDGVEALAEDYYSDHIRNEIEDTSADVESDEDARESALHLLFDQDPIALQRRYAVLLEGGTQSATRRHIQAAFNRRTSSPRVLMAQSQVGREGLNLHEACRVVLQFHAEWNPAILEQQIGRVDRKNSLWEKLARNWLLTDQTMPLPRIEVRQLVFEGTYDAFQWERVGRRQHMFNASLFGALLAEKTLERVPPDKAEELAAAAPDFRPPPCGKATNDALGAEDVVGPTTPTAL